MRAALLLGLCLVTGVSGWLLLAVAVLVGSKVLISAVAHLSVNLQPAVETRNIDLPGKAADEPRWGSAQTNTGRFVFLCELPLVAGLTAAALWDMNLLGVVGGVLCALAALALSGVVALGYLESRRFSGKEALMNRSQEWLSSYNPEVVLYFSGSGDSTYQVNMWLRTLEELPRRSLVVLRERKVANELASTTLPVLCVPKAVDLMMLDFEDARVALYPANTGKNIHMLRNSRMRHVFVGHGDSDKVASVNPFSKVYDEVWTAGRAGRDRYARAAVGVRDEDIVEVGRPQLAPILRTAPEGETKTVLYAPTWEGWTDEPGNTSLITAGPALVSALLRSSSPVRVVYKPHPFTGRRSAEAKHSHKRIVSLINEANRKAGGRTGTPSPTAAKDEDFWSRVDDGLHLVIEGSAPTLYSCFNASHLLISDISSVVADFIASGKPYAITNCEGISEEEFKEKHPTSRASYLLAPDASGLEGALAALTGEDPKLDERHELKDYLLGPDVPSALTRFTAAVDDLYERTDLHVRKRSRSDEDVPVGAR